jgi:hypothetical protein
MSQTYNTPANTTLNQAAPGLLTGASSSQGQVIVVTSIDGMPYTAGTPDMLPCGAVLTVNSDGSFTYVPEPNYVGPDSFTYTAGDNFGDGSNTATVSLQVNPTLKLVPEGNDAGAAGTTITQDVITDDVVLDNPNPSGGVGPLTAFDLAITYDRNVVTTASDGSQISVGSALPAGWIFTVNALTPGNIAIGAFGSGTGADLVTGPAPLVLATIQFTIISPFFGSAQIKLAPTVLESSGIAATSISGSRGTFPLNPSLTDSFVPGVDTYIFAGLYLNAWRSSFLPPTQLACDVNACYNQPLYVISPLGTPPFVFTVASGTLPPGVMLSSNPGLYGAFYGMPTTPGIYNFTIVATDSAVPPNTVPVYLTITIYPALVISTTALPDTSVAMAYNQTIGATGGSGTYTFATTAGTLPTGLTLSTTGVLSGTPTAPGSYSFTVTEMDGTGATVSQNYSITISPETFSQYVVAVLSSSTVPAGSNVLVTVQAADQFGNPITNYSGPPSLMVSISPLKSGNTVPTTVTVNSTGFGAFLATMQNAGAYTISVTGGGFTGSAPVTVTPGPAVKLGFAATLANTPTGVALPPISVQVEDLYGNIVTSDNSDSVTIGVGTGPGSFTSSSTLSTSVHRGVATFGNLTLVTPGTYQLSAIVPTLYTGPYSAAFSILPLQVVPGSFAGTPSGFSLQFNSPFLVNAQTPVLYGQGSGTAAPAPSVIVTTDPANLSDRAAYVAGSLIADPATNTITFLATNTTLQVNNGSPLPADGVYTVIVRSGAATDGFQAANSGGGFLDGLGTGTPGSGDFTASFTVNAAAMHDDVLWVPATADGPGQALSAPGMNRTGGGYPIYLNDRTGNVTSAQVTLTYDPTLLNVTGVSGPGFTLQSSSTPGHAVLQYSGAALPAGMQKPIGFLTATVPGGTTASPVPYRAKDLLHLANAKLNGGAIAVVTSDGLHLVAYVGDASGDGKYSSDDALRITRVLLQADTGFAAYPRVDPIIVADTDGAGFIPADAALQVNEAGVGVPAANLPVPPLPPGAVFMAAARHAAVVNRPSQEIITTNNTNSTNKMASAIAWFAPRRHGRFTEMAALDQYFADSAL